MTTAVITTTWEKEKFLRYSEGVVEFLKKDGTIRKMRFSTKPEVDIPAEKQPKGLRNPSAIISTIRVFDLDKQDWRSIDLTRIISVGDLEE